ncbi:MAG: hypothetical protein P4M00_01800 [Azospirillaceae bacterium]|nr:hypothetical protein [Azospirillaceae bacterium]
MDLLAKVPEMADDALTNLCANAKRLVQAGTARQQLAAQALLPAITAEMALRRDRKTADRTAQVAAAAAARKVRK